MSARYTSPELSRRLRDAGLEQRLAEAVWYPSPTRGGLWSLILGDNGGEGQVRALRLDEVLEELTREREGGPLAHGLMIDWIPSVPQSDWQVMAVGGPVEIRETSDTAVEAATTVLAQLLEARR